MRMMVVVVETYLVVMVVVSSPCYNVESKMDGGTNTRKCKGSSTTQLLIGVG